MERLSRLAVAAALAVLPAAAHAEWYEVRTQHFTIFSDSTPADAQAFAARLERFDGALRELQNMPAHADIAETAKVVVYRFGETDDIGTLVGARDVAGFYMPRAASPVAFTPVRENRELDLIKRSNPQTALNAGTVLQHEYTHHFMLRNFSAAYPKWYVEGFAELNATVELRDDGSFIVGKPVNYRADWLKNAPQFSVRKMLNPLYKYVDYDSSAQLYATGWLLTHYLSFSKPRAGQLAAYLQAVGAGEDGLKAAERIFGDLGKLDNELEKYKSSNLPAISVTPANYRPPVTVITPVEPALARVMSTRIKVSRGETRAQARRRLSELQAGNAPDSLPFQLLVAEAGLDAGDFPAATLAADRALTLDSKSVEAMVFKARAMIEASGGDAARYASARAILVKAHAIDKTDPRPLIEFYNAWRKQAIPVPDEASFALEDAFPLAAQDYSYRMLLTRQLLEQNRMPQAEQVIAPLAYSYDGSNPEKYTPLVVMAKIRDGDRAGALTKIAADYAEQNKDGG
ncbi:MAG: hypothetical protein ABIT09_04600 [Croceibacterium sp.]